MSLRYYKLLTRISKMDVLLTLVTGVVALSYLIPTVEACDLEQDGKPEGMKSFLSFISKI